MSFAIHYTTGSKRCDFHFLLREEEGRWQAYVLEGPEFPPDKLRKGECPPGCERHNGAHRIRWFGMARVASQAQAESLAAWWAEDIDRFIETGKWRSRYKTNDGQDDFVFSIERSGRSFRIYIDAHPSYGNRATDAHSTHRYSDGPRHYICWDGPMRDWAQAEDVATAWAERTQNYIRTGENF
jgi:hypothetical protein